MELPFKPDRFVKLLGILFDNKKLTTQEIVHLMNMKFGWYRKMTETYLRYMRYWGLVRKTEDNTYLVEPLGRAILSLWNLGKKKGATQLFYYAFYMSEEFKTLRVVADYIFNTIENYKVREIRVSQICKELQEKFPKICRTKLDKILSTFAEVGICRKMKQKGKTLYIFDYFLPTFIAFAISLYDFFKRRFVGERYPIRVIYTDVRRLWFMTKSDTERYMLLAQKLDLISLERVGTDINQFYFADSIKGLDDITSRVLSSSELVEI